MTVHRPVTQTALRLSGVQIVPGYRFGFAQPSLVARIEVEAARISGADVVHAFRQAAVFSLPERYQSIKPRTASPVVSMLDLVVQLVAVIQDSAGLPVVEPGKVFAIRCEQGRAGTWLLALPGVSARASQIALQEILRLANLVVETAGDPGVAEQVRALVEPLYDQLARFAPGGTNAPRFLRAALRRRIPFIALPGGVWQFGWGRNGRLFKSTLSDATSAIGTSWARDKVQTNRLLRMAGLPVPQQRIVRDLESALHEAVRIGFPVVLKPADLDQGIGVESGLSNEGELRAAFARVASHNRPVLLEKHVAGQDVRVNVVGGRFRDAIARYPAGVTGDGVLTVAKLVERFNREGSSSAARFGARSRIVLGDEARELLAAQGLAEEAVAEAGRFVRLRRAANVSSGGQTQGVTEELHPDNARLCEQAARILRLDIAGIDLLIPDHRRSWREVGGAICEVNAQPQVGGTYPGIFDHLFDRFVEGQGRIPVIWVMIDDAPCARDLASRMPLDAAGGPLRVIMDSSGAVGAEDLSTSGQVRAALMDPECAALVILSDSAFTDKEGVPLDRIDLLWVAGWSGELAKLSARLAILLPQLEGTEVLFDEFLWQAQGGITFPRDAIPLVLSDGAALERVCARLGIEMAQELTF